MTVVGASIRAQFRFSRQFLEEVFSETELPVLPYTRKLHCLFWPSSETLESQGIGRGRGGKADAPHPAVRKYGGEPERYTRAVSERKTQVGHKRRGIARRFVHHRRRGRAPLAALLAVVGPGVLAGLSDDDPAGVTTYSILGTDFGYQLLWAIPISTALLVLFHLLAIRLAIRSGKGFVALVRVRYGHTAAKMAGAAFVLANFGTICAEFAGIGAVAQLAGLPTAPCVLAAAGLVVGLVLAASFHRVEHVLLALSAVLASYLVSGVLAQPDWSQAARGLVVPSMPPTTSAFIAVTATLGTTLAPWGLAFIQSYAADKGISRRDYGPERIEVVAGSLLTGIIGIFIGVACAATLATAGLHIEDARDAAQALRPLAGEYAVRYRARRSRTTCGGDPGRQRGRRLRLDSSCRVPLQRNVTTTREGATMFAFLPSMPVARERGDATGFAALGGHGGFKDLATLRVIH